jgi:type IV secretion system protein TrbC
MINFSWLRPSKLLVLILLSTGLFNSAAFASTTGGDLPFESTLDMLQKSISGPVLTSISIIMVAVTCVMLAFGEWGDGFKRIINIVLWLSIAFAAVSFLNHMFGAGAVV